MGPHGKSIGADKRKDKRVIRITKSDPGYAEKVESSLDKLFGKRPRFKSRWMRFGYVAG